jgi:hypothetical protein
LFLWSTERALGEILDNGVAWDFWLVTKRMDGAYRLFC